MSLSIKYKLILAFAFILLIPSIIIGYASYQTSKGKVNEHMFNQANENINLLNSTFSQFIKSQTDNIGYLAAELSEATYIGENPPMRLNYMVPYLENHPDVSNVDFGAENGFYVNVFNKEMPADYDHKVRPWYIEAMANKDKAIITDPYISKTTGDHVIGISQVIKDGTGVIHFEVKLETLANVTKDIKIGRDGFIGVLGKDQSFVIHPTREIGTKLSEESPHMKMYQSDTGQYKYIDNDKPKQMTFMTNPETGWKITGTWYDNEVVQEAQPIFKTTVLVIIVSLVIGLILVFFIVASIIKPLKTLMIASEKISEGNLTERISIKSHDEIGQLGNSFNKMADSLQTLLEEVNYTSQQVAAASQELSANAEETMVANSHITKAIQEISNGSQTQMESMTETKQAMVESSQGLQQISEAAASMSESASEVLLESKQGNQVIEQTITQMHSINVAVKDTASVVRELGDSSKEIGKIVEVISDIAGQTNLLALNAAIEAARAGEHGKGFAVVANEVKKLAEQSHHSSEQIAGLIDEIQKKTNHAVDVMEKGTTEVHSGMEIVNEAGNAFKRILHSIEQITHQADEVSSATEQISASTEEITASTDHLNTFSLDISNNTRSVAVASEEQLNSMEEITKSTDSLSQLAQELQNKIGKFHMNGI